MQNNEFFSHLISKWIIAFLVRSHEGNWFNNMATIFVEIDILLCNRWKVKIFYLSAWNQMLSIGVYPTTHYIVSSILPHFSRRSCLPFSIAAQARALADPVPGVPSPRASPGCTQPRTRLLWTLPLRLSEERTRNKAVTGDVFHCRQRTFKILRHNRLRDGNSTCIF